MVGGTFVTGNPLILPLQPWVVAYVVGVLAVKFFAQFMRKLASNHMKDVMPDKKDKIAMHLTKFSLYVLSAGLCAPLIIGVLRDTARATPPANGLLFPLESALANYRYTKWSCSIPTALYMYELVSDPRPSPMTWLHHGAALFGSTCIFMGAVHWFDQNDSVLFGSTIIIVWGSLSWNFMLYGAYAWYHMAKAPRVKLRLAIATKWIVLCGPCLVEHLFLWTYVTVRWAAFHTWSPIFFLVVLDLALLIEHAYLAFVSDSMAKRLRKNVRRDAKKRLTLFGKKVLQVQKLSRSRKDAAGTPQSEPPDVSGTYMDGSEELEEDEELRTQGDLERLVRIEACEERRGWRPLRALIRELKRDAESEASDTMSITDVQRMRELREATGRSATRRRRNPAAFASPALLDDPVHSLPFAQPNTVSNV